mmetsp:Transcript_27660/g.59122  ORF Transcript_27660/g.59122 Transcript_27660/m.59122 type:complete len:108 (+) Transcript_27660:314-637(+)
MRISVLQDYYYNNRDWVGMYLKLTRNDHHMILITIIIPTTTTTIIIFGSTSFATMWMLTKHDPWAISVSWREHVLLQSFQRKKDWFIGQRQIQICPCYLGSTGWTSG